MGWKGYPNLLGIPLNAAPEPTTSGKPAGWKSTPLLTGVVLSGAGERTTADRPAGWQGIPGLTHVFGPAAGSERGPLGWKSYLTLCGVILTHSVRPKVIRSVLCPKTYYPSKTKDTQFTSISTKTIYWKKSNTKSNLYSTNQNYSKFPTKVKENLHKPKEEHKFPYGYSYKFPKKDNPGSDFFRKKEC